MGTRTTVARVAVVAGSLYDQPNNILVDERTAPFAKGRSRGSLYIHLELTGSGTEHDAITKQVLQAMRRAYYGQRGSITAGLRQAVYQANDILLEENRNSLPGEQRVAGVSCAVLRGDDLFIAQAGPTFLYLFRQAQATRYPDRSPWLDGFPPEEVGAAVLGERRDLNVDLFHSQIGSGDTFLLASSGLAQMIAPETWSRILSQSPVTSLLEDLRRKGGDFELSALVVRLADGAVDDGESQPAAQADAREAVRREAVRRETPPQATPSGRQAATPSPAQTVASAGRGIDDSKRAPEPAREILDRSLVQEEGFEEPYEKEALAGGESTWQRIAGAVTQIRVGERLKPVLGTMAAALTGLWYGLRSLVSRMVPERLAAAPSPVASERPARRRERAPAKAPSESVQKLLLGVAIAIPIIVAVIVLVAWFQRGQARRSAQEELWQQASSFWVQAQAEADVGMVRTHLANAQEKVDEYLIYQPESAEAVELRNKIQVRLDGINQVKRVTSVWKLNTYPADANLTRVVVQGAHIFVMDRHGGHVYHHSMDPQLQHALEPLSTEATLVSRGDTVGNVVVGDLVDMVWMPTGPNRQKASLLILESGGTILDYDPATRQMITLRVAANEMWKFPRLVGSHSGRFYVLDSGANKIWRYDPTEDGYNSVPTDWLQIETDLAGVVGMAIGDSIYLLYTDGAIGKFSIGEADTFDISDWDTPPSNPTAIFTRPPAETRWIYIADRGNSRIVQSSKGGQFAQQFRMDQAAIAEIDDPLAGATDLFVDEITGQAYLLSGRDLYLLELPMSE